ncbi:MAG: glycosyltransferase [Desulfobacula sp.]|jgi:glycosyltransferase involved in cell wall biosynthesis|nr:glycosyltransferase [Desulfobacula sp.]
MIENEPSDITKVSVVVPTYHQPEYFPICLDSIWFQNYQNIEIIFVNDGSQDNTKEIIEQYLENIKEEETSFARYYNEETDSVERCYHLRYPNDKKREIKVIHHEENMGLGAALNKGFRACTGEYCTYIASDDYFYPTMVSDCVKAIEDNQFDFVFADINIVDDAGRIMHQFNYPDYSFDNSFLDWYFCGICKLYKRSLHDELGFYKEELFAHDHEMYLRFAMNGKSLFHINKVLAVSRYHGSDRLTGNHTTKRWNRLFEESKSLVRTARKFNTSKNTIT